MTHRTDRPEDSAVSLLGDSENERITAATLLLELYRYAPVADSSAASGQDAELTIERARELIGARDELVAYGGRVLMLNIAAMRDQNRLPTHGYNQANASGAPLAERIAASLRLRAKDDAALRLQMSLDSLALRLWGFTSETEAIRRRATQGPARTPDISEIQTSPLDPSQLPDPTSRKTPKKPNDTDSN